VVALSVLTIECLLPYHLSQQRHDGGCSLSRRGKGYDSDEESCIAGSKATMKTKRGPVPVGGPLHAAAVATESRGVATRGQQGGTAAGGSRSAKEISQMVLSCMEGIAVKHKRSIGILSQVRPSPLPPPSHPHPYGAIASADPLAQISHAYSPLLAMPVSEPHVPVQDYQKPYWGRRSAHKLVSRMARVKRFGSPSGCVSFVSGLSSTFALLAGTKHCLDPTETNNNQHNMVYCVRHISAR